MVYTESIRGYPYMKKEQLAKEFPDQHWNRKNETIRN